jgi:hypothetical protein
VSQCFLCTRAAFEPTWKRRLGNLLEIFYWNNIGITGSTTILFTTSRSVHNCAQQMFSDIGNPIFGNLLPARLKNGLSYLCSCTETGIIPKKAFRSRPRLIFLDSLQHCYTKLTPKCICYLGPCTENDIVPKYFVIVAQAYILLSHRYC